MRTRLDHLYSMHTPSILRLPRHLYHALLSTPSILCLLDIFIRGLHIGTVGGVVLYSVEFQSKLFNALKFCASDL